MPRPDLRSGRGAAPFTPVGGAAPNTPGHAARMDTCSISWSGRGVETGVGEWRRPSRHAAPGGKPAGNGQRKGALATLAGSAALARPAAARSGYAAAQREGPLAPACFDQNKQRDQVKCASMDL